MEKSNKWGHAKSLLLSLTGHENFVILFSAIHDAQCTSNARVARPYAGVVEWQTRWTQNPIWATMCGFKSHLRHQKGLTICEVFFFGLYDFFVHLNWSSSIMVNG